MITVNNKCIYIVYPSFGCHTFENRAAHRVSLKPERSRGAPEARMLKAGARGARRGGSWRAREGWRLETSCSLGQGTH